MVDLRTPYQSSASDSPLKLAMWILQAGTLTPVASGSGVGSLTITGWTAAMGLFALLAVIAGAAVYGYRQYRGLDAHRGYTMVVKRGQQT